MTSKRQSLMRKNYAVKLLRTFALLSFLSSTLLLASCSQENPRTQASSGIDSSQLLTISLDMELGLDLSEGSSLRALDATVDKELNDEGIHGVTVPDQVPVITIIRSDDPADPVTYATGIQAIRRTGSKKYSIKKLGIPLEAGSTFATGKKWYVMFVAGGIFNPATKKLEINSASRPGISASNRSSSMDLPMATRWLELPTDASGTPIDAENWPFATHLQEQHFYGLGVICRATLRLDEEYKPNISAGTSTTVQVQKLKAVSTALSFAGTFDLSKLPAFSSTGRPKLTYENLSAVSSPDEYEFPSTNDGIPENQVVYEAIAVGAILEVSGKQGDPIFGDNPLPNTANKRRLPHGIQAFYFWAMPMADVVANKTNTTLIALTGTSDNRKILEPKYTYIYGKKHGKVAPQEGKALYFDGVFFHPYTPLDYMAESNVQRKNPTQWVPGGIIPTGFRNELSGSPRGDIDARNNEWNAFIPLAEALKISISNAGRTYKTPSRAQFESIFPYLTTHYGAMDFDDVPIYVKVGLLEGSALYSYRANFPQNSIEVHWQKGTHDYFGDYRVVRALKNFNNNNKRLVVYYYRDYEGWFYEDLRSSLILPQNGTHFGSKTAEEYSTREGKMAIYAMHLGEYYIGNMDDLKALGEKVRSYPNNTYRREDRSILWRATPDVVVQYQDGFRTELLLPKIQEASRLLIESPKDTPSPMYYAISDADRIAPAYQRGGFYKLDPNLPLEHAITGAPIPRSAFDLIRYVVRPFTSDERP